MSDTMKRMWTERQVRALGVDAAEQKENLKVFEHIVDKDGHKRFIDGDITMETITGVTQTYGKWSLSGSHLLIVIAGTAANGATMNGLIATVDIPSWIKDKIVPLAGTVVDTYSMSLRAADNTTQSTWCGLFKSGDYMQAQVGSVTLTADRNFRATFDLLIDNE